MKCNGVVVLVAVLLMIDCSGYMCNAATVTDRSIALITKMEQAQSYTPPQRGTPGRREGGSTR